MEGAFILCADDFAIKGASPRGILSLAQEGRLSATSAIVTARQLAFHAKAVMQLRSRFAVGLHLNLTFGRPLGPSARARPGRATTQIGIGFSVGFVAGRVDRREMARRSTVSSIDLKARPVARQTSSTDINTCMSFRSFGIL